MRKSLLLCSLFFLFVYKPVFPKSDVSEMTELVMYMDISGWGFSVHLIKYYPHYLNKSYVLAKDFKKYVDTVNENSKSITYFKKYKSDIFEFIVSFSSNQYNEFIYNSKPDSSIDIPIKYFSNDKKGIFYLGALYFPRKYDIFKTPQKTRYIEAFSEVIYPAIDNFKYLTKIKDISYLGLGVVWICYDESEEDERQKEKSESFVILFRKKDLIKYFNKKIDLIKLFKNVHITKQSFVD